MTANAMRIPKEFKYAILIIVVLHFLSYSCGLTFHLWSENPLSEREIRNEGKTSHPTPYSINITETLNIEPFHAAKRLALVPEVPSIKLRGKKLGKSPEKSISLVVYNRVPKCASSAMIWLITKLQTQLGFTIINDNWPRIKQYLTEDEQNELIRNVTSSVRFPRKAIFIRHLHFFDFSKHVKIKPRYINVYRDPVERFISHYYYMRNGFVQHNERESKKWKKPITESRQNITIEECIMRDPACVAKNAATTLAFFCGQDPSCRKPSRWALDRAKKNIMQYYLFVGLAEDLPNTLKILEKLLPGYFKNAQVAIKGLEGISTNTKTSGKKIPPEEVKRKIRSDLKYEVELYEFIKERFYLKLNEVNRITKELT